MAKNTDFFIDRKYTKLCLRPCYFFCSHRLQQIFTAKNPEICVNPVIFGFIKVNGGIPKSCFELLQQHL